MLTNIQIKDSMRDSNIILPVKTLTKFIKCLSHQTNVFILLLLLIDIITFIVNVKFKATVAVLIDNY